MCLSSKEFCTHPPGLISRSPKGAGVMGRTRMARSQPWLFGEHEFFTVTQTLIHPSVRPLRERMVGMPDPKAQAGGRGSSAG